MLTIPGRPVRTCEGWSRRELMRVGGAGLLGLNLPEFLSWKALAAAPAKLESRSKAFGAAKSVIMLFLQGGPSHIDIWDPEAGCALEHPRRVQADQDQSVRHPGQRNHAHAGRPDGQGHADPLDELHAGGTVQSHGGDLSDDDRLSAGQGFALGPARAALAARLPAHGLPHLQDEAARGAHAAVRRDAAPAAGIERHRQGRRRRLPGQGVRSLPPLPGPEQGHRSSTISPCAPTSRRSG